MNLLQSRIEKNIYKSKKKSGEKIFHEVSFIFAREFGWSYNDISEAPISFVLEMVNELEISKKREQAAYKKKGR